MDNYKDKMKVLLKSASKDAQKIVGATIKIEKENKSFSLGKNANEDVINSIVKKVKGIIQ